MDSQTITNQGGVGLQVNIGQVFGSIQQPAELPTPFQAPPLPPDPLLVGREGLLRKLKGLLVAHGSVALDGLPGAGKTSLAVSLANDMALYPKEFPDGVLWVGLGRHPAELDRLAYWGRSLGLPAPGMSKPSSVTEWAELIHAVVGSRRMLLVVDDAWDSRIALAFRLGGPECGHLLTTRRYEVATAFAGTAGELPVHELADDEAGELLSRLAPSAMREHPEAMHKLVGQMGGLPLAVNLLGRYLESQSRAGMGQEAVGELRDVHRRLEVGAEQSALDHHPDIDPDVSLSLLAIIGVSDDALDEAGKRALRSLAAFPAKPSTFSKTAATAVADAPAAVIASLVQAGLVERVGDRFTIHQTIADYARVESSDPAAGGRMADFFTQFVEAHEQEFLRGGTAGEWLDQLEADQDNLRAVFRWSKELGEAEAGLRLGAALWRFWEARGFYKEGRDALEELLQLQGASARTRPRARALNGAGDLAYRYGDYEHARTFHEEGLAILRELQDNQGVADGINDLANITNALGDYPAADRLYRESLEMQQLLGNSRGQAVALNNLGYVAQRRGEYANARAFLRESLKAFEDLGDEVERGFPLTGLGLVALFEGRFEEARHFFEEGARVRTELGDRRGLAESTGGLGLVALRTGDLKTAEHLSEESLLVRRELDDRPGIAFSLTNLALLRGYQGYQADSSGYGEEALEIRRGLGDRRGSGDSLWALGLAALVADDDQSAALRFEESLDVRQDIGDRRGICESWEGVAAARHREGKDDQAADLLGRARDLRQEIGAPVPPIDQTWHQAEFKKIALSPG